VRKDIVGSLVAIVLLTVGFGLVYPLAMTGVAQVTFNRQANGSQVERDGKVVGSDLIGQDFRALERPHTPGLTAAGVPVDAVTTSASGVDPHISPANARIQANRIAAVRGAPLDRILTLVRQSTDERAIGVLGEPGVNVLELNLAVDKEFPVR
jgi:potassium-transporting ATPase KdpC subunit